MVRDLQSPKIRQPQKVWSIALIGVVLMGAASQTMAQSAAIAESRPTLTTQLAQSAAQPPQRVVRRVRRDLAQRFNLPPRTLRVVSASRETWPDSCLGLAAPNERCATATVEGWRIEMTNGQQNWVYRTNLQAQVIKLETEDTATLPPQVVDRLFETIAREAKVPANTLKVIESQPRTWDGCMGIFEPDQFCTQIAISGYRVIVMGDQQSWVYHVDQEGTRIVQNTTASGSTPPIFVSFMPTEMPDPTEDIVFQMTLSGGLSGDVTETVLTTDGILYSRSSGMRASVNSAPTIIKRLSQQQVEQFQQLLKQQKFPNLDGLRYLTPEALADYPTTVLQGMGSTVAYIDLAEDNLPASLQTVIDAWTQINAPQ
jgi:hypothetical protein